MAIVRIPSRAMLFRVFTFVFVCIPSFSLADEISEAKQRWAVSPHGPFLERLLPPTFEARQLPAPPSAGARPVARSSLHCPHLPHPPTPPPPTSPGSPPPFYH